MRSVFFLCLGLALTACAQGEEQILMGTRHAAKDAVNEVVAQRLPGVNIAPYSDCIFDNASTREIFLLAKGATLGVDGETTAVVLEIAKRKETVLCLAKNGALKGLI